MTMDKPKYIRLDGKLIFSIIVVLLYTLMLLENRYNFIFPNGDLSGINLLVFFVSITILACIAAVFAYKSAFMAKKNKTINLIILLILSAALSSASLYFMSNNLLTFHKSIADEIDGVLDKLHPRAFHGIYLAPPPTSLLLNNRGIYLVPPKIYQLGELKGLGLGGNQIEYISPQIASMKSLMELDLSRNQLSSLPNELSLLPIKYLYLQSNQFVIFPEDFRFPGSLENLFIDHNQLISLSKALVNCTSLKHLLLQNNQLSALPDTLGNLSQLESLSLIQNRFAEFPAVILKLKNLTYLGLSHNQIKSLPLEVATLTKLKDLHLGDNPIPREQVNELSKKLPGCKITFEN